ncbi:MAG TPA: hypothetical protein VFZ44_02315 [Pyrinomonadaceae bacterium]
MTQQAPQTPVCWFCARRPPDRDSASEWEMYRETGVKDEEVASIAKPEWEPVTVPVPRCAECRRAHDRRENFVEKGWKAGLLVGLALLAALFVLGLLGVGGLIVRIFTPRRAIVIIPVVVVGSGIVGGLVGWLLGKSSLPPGVRDQGAATLHPNIRRMEEQGWKIGAKPRV